MEKNSKILWKASQKEVETSQLNHYRLWVNDKNQLNLRNYKDLYEWSVKHHLNFWESLLEYFDIQYSGSYHQVCSDEAMPYCKWFEGIQLNYAEHIFRNYNEHNPAIISILENKDSRLIGWKELSSSVSNLQAWLMELGLQPGDRVAAYCSNISESSISLLSCMASGFIWSSCSPDFGAGSCIDRFQQIEPKVLFAVSSYSYSGRIFDRRKEVERIALSLKSLKAIVWIDPWGTGTLPIPGITNMNWNDWPLASYHLPKFIRLPFSHPLWILYSSGTTGLPKPIVHGHGGMLLEHLKYLSFHNNVRKGELFFWYSTTGWMMWNFLHASLLVGATAVIYDGSPAFPDLNELWRKSENLGIHHFGTSAPFLVACMKEDIHPKEIFNLSSIKTIGSTGSPLPPEAFLYVYDHIIEDVCLGSMSGGTDVCTAFVGTCIERPVRVGEIQCRCLGVAMEAWNDEGKPIEGEMGEMVLIKPMPCMPVMFWNDPDFKRYIGSYFEYYPGIWRHGDWIEITDHDGLIIYGRSDATLNRQGVRIGTAEIYNVLNGIEAISDALIINVELDAGRHFMPLFIQLNEHNELDNTLIKLINSQLKEKCSPRHVPDKIFTIPEIPYTISGKKMEAPVKKILLNMPLEKAYNPDAMKNPQAMEYFILQRERILAEGL